MTVARLCLADRCLALYDRRPMTGDGRMLFLALYVKTKFPGPRSIRAANKRSTVHEPGPRSTRAASKRSSVHLHPIIILQKITLDIRYLFSYLCYLKSSGLNLMGL